MAANDADHRHPVRKIITLAALWSAVPAVGAVVSRKLARGDEDSPELRVAAIGWGKDLQIHSRSLRSLEAVAVMGGIKLDLTDASPDPDGAMVEVLAIMGGVEITVPSDWAVQVEHTAIAGGVDTQVPHSGDLPPEAPVLTIRVRAYMGGVQVSAATA